MLPWILFYITLALLIISIAVAIRFIRRALVLDELFDYLQDDLQTNVKYLVKLVATDLYANTPEVIEVHNNMGIMLRRLQEFSLRSKEITNKLKEGEVE